MKTKPSVSVFWFRRDLRLEDNRGLSDALNGPVPVLPIFVFDPQILERLADRDDPRVTFIWKSLADLHDKLKSLGSGLMVFHCAPAEAFRNLQNRFKIEAVYTNHDYEPEAIRRDRDVERALKASGVPFKTSKDQCVFEKNEVAKDDGSPYTVFTPFSRKWLKRLTPGDCSPIAMKRNFFSHESQNIPGLKDIGFTPSPMNFPDRKVKSDLIKRYSERRDFPALEATTRLGLHLRFGTVSVRKCVGTAVELNETWLNELIWREFFMQILWHFPHVTERSFKPAYDKIKWLNREDHFLAWCEGRTGYPLVDAGMRELNQTGFMHNRARMVAASFLCKHLLIDWRWGERYFARRLLDFDLASNNGNWQWAAGSGCDAAPYFRVFNPAAQQKKFDPDFAYIRHWVPEFGSDAYPEPIVDHDHARKRALATYGRALAK